MRSPLAAETPSPDAAAAAARRRLLHGIAAGVGAAAIWGVQAVVSRQSVAEGLTPADVTVLRFLVAGLILLPVAWRMKPFAVGPLGLKRGLLLALMIGAPYSMVLVAGAAYAPAIHASVIASGLNPVLATVLGVLVARERPGAVRVVGAALIVVGLVLFAWRAFDDGGGRAGAWRGDLLFATNATIFVIYARLVTAWRVPARAATATICVLSMLMLPLWVWAAPSGFAQASFGAILWQAVYQGGAVGFGSMLLFTRAVELIGPVRAAMFVPVMPLTTAVVGALVLDEWPQAMEWAGMAVVIAGMALALGGRARGGATRP